MASVTLRDVRKVYSGGVEAVRGVSLDIPDGSFTVLVGPSGCGKSTLLRMVAGLEGITSGTVTIGSREVNDLEPAERDIAMVFQNYALYPHMSVYDNMAYGLRNRGTPKAEIDAAVREAAQMLGVVALLERRPRALSGGQRQRVAMGRAIVRRPQVFLFDEPLSNLDAKLRVQMRLEIKRLQRKLGVTAIYVTHDQVEAMTLSDQLVVMNGGRIEQVGTATELYRKPGTKFVAGFIGSPSMNMLPGRIEASDAISIGATRLGLATATNAAPGTAVEVGIRPEDVLRAPNGSVSGPIRLTNDFVEELGAVEIVHGTVEGSPMAAQISAGSLPSGQALDCYVAPASLHLFDPADGRRLGD